MPDDWLLRIGNGNHFNKSSKYKTWGITSTNKEAAYFMKNIKEDDRLWFVKSNSNGQLVAVATYTNMQARELGPLIAVTHTNEELGWTETNGNWDTEVHYKDLYNLTLCEMFSGIQSPRVFRKYNEKCKVNLPEEYPHIVRYSKVTCSI